MTVYLGGPPFTLNEMALYSKWVIRQLDPVEDREDMLLWYERLESVTRVST